MLPKLRIILAAVIATCAAVLALSAGMLSGVPDVSRTLVRQAIVAEPEWHQSHLLAYSRRADELLRLRDLPVTPVRAVVEYAEQAQARAAETANAPAATPPVGAPADSAAIVTVPADTPATVAMAPAADPPADTSAATTASATAIAAAPVTLPAVEAPTVAAPVDTATAPATNALSEETPATAPAASGDTKVAAVQTGGSETAEMYGPDKSKAKPRHRARAARARLFKPKSKAQVTHVARSIAPASATGFALEQQNAPPSNPEQNRSNGAFGSWRYRNAGTTR